MTLIGIAYKGCPVAGVIQPSFPECITDLSLHGPVWGIRGIGVCPQLIKCGDDSDVATKDQGTAALSLGYWLYSGVTSVRE